MKKILLFVLMLGVVLSFAGCNLDNFTITTEDTSTTISTTTTSTTTTTTTGETSIDIDQLKSDVYQMILNNMYDTLYSEILSNLSQAEFDAIYNQVISDLLSEIDAGNITVSPVDVATQILNIVANQATAVLGVSNYLGNDLQAIGSGVVYKKLDNTYYLVTNNHVVEDGDNYKIELADGTEITANLLGTDSTADIAVLSFTTTLDLTVVSFADSDTVEKGTMVLAVGNPSGYDYYQSVTFGIVSGLNRYFDTNSDGAKDMFVGYIQHDASINAGNSGGALFNLQGEVIGINVIKIADVSVEGMGFAIPSSLVSAICSDIEQYGYSKQLPTLGIGFWDLSDSDIRTYVEATYHVTIPSTITNGFYIVEVVSDSTVDGYVEVGDIILQVGDIEITDSVTFVGAFQQYSTGDVIDIVVYRNGQTITLTDITLKAKPVA